MNHHFEKISKPCWMRINPNIKWCFNNKISSNPQHLRKKNHGAQQPPLETYTSSLNAHDARTTNFPISSWLSRLRGSKLDLRDKVGRPKRNTERAMKQGPRNVVWGIIHDHTIQLYIGTIINHELRIPFLNNQDSIECYIRGFWSLLKWVDRVSKQTTSLVGRCDSLPATTFSSNHRRISSRLPFSVFGNLWFLRQIQVWQPLWFFWVQTASWRCFQQK